MMALTLPGCKMLDSRLREAGAEVVCCLTRGAPKGPNLPRARLNHQDALFPGHGLATHSQTWDILQSNVGLAIMKLKKDDGFPPVTVTPSYALVMMLSI
ncbi:hypothetical protein HPB47_001063 [Ixodes persulcatus]|uniref:Uncharacterized protein n=1 Tax=Ixodes persulcatus TaxID=34615 RepID=A0AC60PQ31_IXOPE|nr:hypothetical protein HPB47_001063 [Ixodes persulcatus]